MKKSDDDGGDDGYDDDESHFNLFVPKTTTSTQKFVWNEKDWERLKAKKDFHWEDKTRSIRLADDSKHNIENVTELSPDLREVLHKGR